MTDDQDDIVDMLRSAAESTWPNHLLTASAKEIEQLREAGDRLAYWVLRENVSRELIAFAKTWKTVRGD